MNSSVATRPECSTQDSVKRSVVAAVGRLMMVVAANLVLFELLLQAINAVHPLFRPAHLVDTAETVAIEGSDWRNGADRLFFYRPKPDSTTHGHPFRVNQLGFRGREILDRSTVGSDTFRIMVLGDSFTVGLGVAEEDRYTDVLERALQKQYPGTKIEVINLGVQGFETVQELKTLKRLWCVIQPELTIVGFYDNDPNVSYQRYVCYRFPVSPEMRRLLEPWLSFRIPEVLYDPLARWIKDEPNHLDEIAAAYRTDSRDWHIFEESVHEISRFVREKSGRQPLVLGLMSTDASNTFPWQQARETFVRAGFQWIDLGSNFRVEAVSRFDFHPGPRNHQQYAERLSKTIISSGIIPEWQKSITR
ncbi:MAG: SGNH/GDSL hydrolase family protein [Verrucomicrobiia bacterium]